MTYTTSDIPQKVHLWHDGRNVMILQSSDLTARVRMQLESLAEGEPPRRLQETIEQVSDKIGSLRVDFGESIEDLAADIEQGAVVIASVNEGLIWGQASAVGSGYSQSLMPVVGVARDQQSHEVVGFCVLDLMNDGIERLVDAAALESGWLELGGIKLVSEAPT